MGHGRSFFRAAVVAALVGWVSVGALVVGVEQHLYAQLGQVPGAFVGLSDRPAPSANGSDNYLVLLTGAIEGDDASPWVGGSADTLLLVHLDAERRRPLVLALPLDEQALDKTIRLGGPAELVGSVEKLTGVRVEHLVVVTWSGLAAMVQHVGGVSVTLTGGTVDPDTGREWALGAQRLGSADVLPFVSQRRGLPNGEVDRARRQLYVLRALLNEALAQEMRKQPRLLYAFLDSASRATAIDDEWSVGQLRALAWSLRSLRSAGVVYVALERAGMPDMALWQAVRDDSVEGWLASHPDAVVPAAVN